MIDYISWLVNKVWPTFFFSVKSGNSEYTAVSDAFDYVVIFG